MIDVVSLLGIIRFGKTSLRRSDTIQLLCDPIGEHQSLHRFWVITIGGWHLFEGDLSPDSFPGLAIDGIY